MVITYLLGRTSDENTGSYPDRRCHSLSRTKRTDDIFAASVVCIMGRQLHEFRKPVQTFCGGLY
jgi:hypothetical protein